ncbi:MAG: YihY/virulence factor BrkB family protein [Ruminococcaceae bacterium]|nr:YihY/virulence factor BrkB family protein [Oscillospiraceae bacterium]
MKNKIDGMGKKAGKLCNEFLSGDFFGLAAELSFYLLSSFLPMVILVFTVASSISQHYTDAVLEAISVLPQKAAKLLVSMLISTTRSTTVIAATGAFSLFTLSGFILSVKKSLNRFYNTSNEYSFLKSEIMAFTFALLMYISIIASFGLIIFGEVIGTHLLSSFSSDKFLSVWNSSRYIFVILFLVLMISLLFKALPGVKLRIIDVLPGAVLTTVGWYVTSMIFALYVNNFPQYEIIYGSLAGFAGLIMWIYLTGFVVLLGAKINAMIYLRKEEKRKEIEAKKIHI